MITIELKGGKHKAVYIDGVATFIVDLKPIEKIDCPF